MKDLARSFRNYSDQGYYLDDWFPRYNVRFISLFHQPLDSYKEPQNMRSIAVPIQGVLNENHCAETSDKVREVFDMKRRNGEHIGSFAAYGYLKDPNDKNALVVDEEAAGVVRDIFQMFLDGMSKNAIVRHLNDHGVLCPALYKQERLGLKYQNPQMNMAKRRSLSRRLQAGTPWVEISKSKFGPRQAPFVVRHDGEQHPEKPDVLRRHGTRSLPHEKLQGPCAGGCPAG